MPSDNLCEEFTTINRYKFIRMLLAFIREDLEAVLNIRMLDDIYILKLPVQMNYHNCFNNRKFIKQPSYSSKTPPRVRFSTSSQPYNFDYESSSIKISTIPDLSYGTGVRITFRANDISIFVWVEEGDNIIVKIDDETYNIDDINTDWELLKTLEEKHQKINVTPEYYKIFLK